MTTVYISGPMSQLPDDNFPAFIDAAKKLRALGLEVLSPAEHGLGSSVKEMFRWDLNAVLDSDVVVVLPGWLSSRGARIEIDLAVRCDIPVLDLHVALQDLGAESNAS